MKKDDITFHDKTFVIDGVTYAFRTAQHSYGVYNPRTNKEEYKTVWATDFDTSKIKILQSICSKLKEFSLYIEYDCVHIIKDKFRLNIRGLYMTTTKPKLTFQDEQDFINKVFMKKERCYMFVRKDNNLFHVVYSTGQNTFIKSFPLNDAKERELSNLEKDKWYSIPCIYSWDNTLFNDSFSLYKNQDGVHDLFNDNALTTVTFNKAIKDLFCYSKDDMVIRIVGTEGNDTINVSYDNDKSVTVPVVGMLDCTFDVESPVPRLKLLGKSKSFTLQTVSHINVICAYIDGTTIKINPLR